MVPPPVFDAACAEFTQFSRNEHREFEKKFDIFDEDGNGIIDFFELKRAQEKMGLPKTHSELKEIMASMAQDPEKGITFRDFIKVQIKVQNLKGTPSGASGGFKIDIPPEISFIQACNDFSVGGIKSFHEQAAKQREQELENERKIKEAQQARKDGKYRAQIEKQKEEAEKKAAEEKRKADRAAFKARQAAAFEGK